MKENRYWKIPYAKPFGAEMLSEYGCNPLLASVLAYKGIAPGEETDRFINCSCDLSLDRILSIRGMDAAVRRLRQALDNSEKMVVYGDYDVDGITATCVLTLYLRESLLSRHPLCDAASFVIPYIPDRNDEGYGLNSDALKRFKADGVSLVITVDCGITAFEEADEAANLGLSMIITDHHECKKPELPCAAAVIDPKCEDGSPFRTLAGVGVAGMLACACEGNVDSVVERYCDYMAVGTVADVMPLSGINRYLVKKGLARINASPRPGFAALIRTSGLKTEVSASSIGFSLAPRINAAGRIDKAMTALALLLSDGSPVDLPDLQSKSPDRNTVSYTPDRLAEELSSLNDRRKGIEQEIWEEAKKMLSGHEDGTPIVLYKDGWEPGVIGIAASRLSEYFCVPAIMICSVNDHGKGSCRSYGNFNLYGALEACSQHLISFGGHALAAGLNIEVENVDAFREAFTEYYRSHLPEPAPELSCDLLIRDFSLLSVENVRSLDLLEPLGTDNPRPLMCAFGITASSIRQVGANGKHLQLEFSTRSGSFSGIFFSRNAAELGISEGDLVDVAFSPQINSFRGNDSVQFLVSGLRKHDPSELCSRILAGEYLFDRSYGDVWAAAGSFPACEAKADAVSADDIPEEFYKPVRNDFALLWSSIVRSTERFGPDFESVISQCPDSISPEEYCVCLMVFLELGLISSDDGSSIYNAYVPKSPAKVDLKSSGLLQYMAGNSNGSVM